MIATRNDDYYVYYEGIYTNPKQYIAVNGFNYRYFNQVEMKNMLFDDIERDIQSIEASSFQDTPL